MVNLLLRNHLRRNVPRGCVGLAWVEADYINGDPCT
jgi:hypothetical protein